MTLTQELNTVKELVEHILATNPETRNSDTKLYIEACKYMGAETIDDIAALNLSIISVHKTRQVIQNTEGKYQPDEAIKQERGRRRLGIRDYMARIKKESVG